MKDSRIGTYGTLALIATLALKGTALAQIDPGLCRSSSDRRLCGSALAAVLALAMLLRGRRNGKVSRTTSEMTRKRNRDSDRNGLIAGLLV